MDSKTEVVLVDCGACGGDGKETCNNPDHGFIYGIGGEVNRLGCPVCGRDENYKVPGGGDCEACKGKGKVPMCTDQNCVEPSIGDYNGHGAFACEHHMESWNRYFDNEYQ